MSIGIMDADIAKYTLVPFNLEVMKLSAYYKKKGEIVALSPQFSPEKYQNFIYRKDYDDGDFPINLTCEPNVTYGGLAFSNNKYAPLPLEVERMAPDPLIYSKMENKILHSGHPLSKKIFQNMIECEHARISLDGKTVWDGYPYQFKYLSGARNLMLHDYDLGAIDGGFETVKHILERARNDGWATRIGMKFPVQINDGQSLLNWSSLKTNSTFYSARYNGVIDDDAFIDWVQMCKEKAVYSQMEYYVATSSYDEDHFVKDLLPKIFRQVIISRSYRIFFSLKYTEGFFKEPMWEEVIKLINCYHNSYSGKPQSKYLMKISDDTMFDFVSNAQNIPNAWYGEWGMTKQHMREIFVFVRENNPELFKDFYECSARKIGGII